MRILITGSSGQLGAEIARQLDAEKEHEVIGLDLAPGKWTTFVGDISNYSVLANSLKDCEAVIHTASLHARHLQSHSKQDFINTNVTSLLNLLELCSQQQLRRFVYTSTTSVYGLAMLPTTQAVWVTERLAPQPRDIYDVTKIAAEQLCKIFALEKGLKTICLRTSRFFPEMPELLAKYRLYRGADVRDVARAHILAVTNKEIDFDIFNISAQHPFKEKDLVALLHDPVSVLERYYPAIKTIFQQHGWQLPNSIDRVYVTDYAQAKLGYTPQYNFEEFIASF